MNNNEPALLDIDGLCSMLGIGKNTAYDLLSNSEIEAFKIGTVWKIPRKKVDEYIERKCNERQTKKVMCTVVDKKK